MTRMNRCLPLLACASIAFPASIAHAAPPKYVSAFEAYTRYADQPLASWKTSNDEVARIGGWKAYAREAQEKTQKQPVPPAASTPHTYPH